MMCEKIIECIDKFAPKKEVVIKTTTLWLANEKKTQLSTEIASSENGLKTPTPKIVPSIKINGL